MANLVLFLVGLVLVWKVGSAVLRLVAWVLAAVIAVRVVIGAGVSFSMLATAAGCWAGAEVLFRLRFRCWRSPLVAFVAGWAGAPVGDEAAGQG